jgi:hypothetical protein
MGIKLWVEMVCKDCSGVGYGTFVRGSTISVFHFKEEARLIGWKCVKGEFQCVDCQKVGKDVTPSSRP